MVVSPFYGIRFSYAISNLVTNKARCILTATAARLPTAATPNKLNIAEPTMVPMPMSDCVRKVEITLTKNSGQDVATDMKVAAATF